MTFVRSGAAFAAALLLAAGIGWAQSDDCRDLPNGDLSCRGPDGRWTTLHRSGGGDTATPADQGRDRDDDRDQPRPPPPRPAPARTSPYTDQQLADMRGDAASPLHVWIGSAPNEVKNGKTFFSTAGLDEAAFRRIAHKVFNDNIVFFPVQHNMSVSMEEYGPDRHRRQIQEYLLPFCRARAPACHAPYGFFDGAIVVSNAEGRESRVYLNFYDERQNPHNRYCAVLAGRVSCRISPPMFMDHQMSVGVADTYGMIDTIESGYESGSQPADITGNIALAASPRAHGELLACISYDASQAYTVLVDSQGNEHGMRDYSEPDFTIVNICKFPIHVVVEVGGPGDCPARFADIFANALLGTRREYRLKSHEGGPLGKCRGTLTTLERG